MLLQALRHDELWRARIPAVSLQWQRLCCTAGVDCFVAAGSAVQLDMHSRGVLLLQRHLLWPLLCVDMVTGMRCYRGDYCSTAVCTVCSGCICDHR